jgi:hypothetical protein
MGVQRDDLQLRCSVVGQQRHQRSRRAGDRRRRALDGSHGHRRAADLGRPQPERVFRAADTEGKTDSCSCSGLARRDHRCQIFRDRKMVAAAPARQASPQVPKLSIHAMTCEVPPNWSSVTPNRSVPRKLAPKRHQTPALPLRRACARTRAGAPARRAYGPTRACRETQDSRP